MKAASCFLTVCRQRQRQLLLQPNRASSIRFTATTSPRAPARSFRTSTIVHNQSTDSLEPPRGQEHPELQDDIATTIVCKNLPFAADKDTVWKEVSKYGTVKSVELPSFPLNSRNGKPRHNRVWGQNNGGFCFVTFASEAEAEAAKKAMDGSELGGRVLNVLTRTVSKSRLETYKKAEAERKKAGLSSTLFYGNLAPGTKREALLETFSQYGTVRSIKLPKKSRATIGKGQEAAWADHNGGYCFVKFATYEEAKAALEALNGTTIGDRAITLAFANMSEEKATVSKEDAAKVLLKVEYKPKPLSERDQEYIRTEPLVTGTVTRAGKMLKTVAVTTNRRRLDKDTQTHHVEEHTVLVHDAQGILVEGDVVKYQHFPPDLYAERSERGKTKVKFVLKEVVTPFGKPLEERELSQELVDAMEGRLIRKVKLNGESVGKKTATPKKEAAAIAA